MSKPKTLEDCETCDEVNNYLDAHGAPTIRTKNHKIHQLPNGRILPVPQGHRKPLGRGLKVTIIKICLLAGISIVAVMYFW